MAALPVPTNKISAEAVETVLVKGDLSSLRPAERVAYYQAVCESLGLNPLTQPFAYIQLNGKLTLYAKRDCTDQLRQINGISITITAREVTEGCYIVTAQAKRADGRTDESIGAVPIDGLKGEARSNAMMKAETKGKRRVTLSICGLAVLDESEVSSVRGAVLVEEPRGSVQAAQEVAQSKITEMRKPQPAVAIAEQLPAEPYQEVEYEEVEMDPEERSQLERELAESIALVERRKEMLEAFATMKKRYAAIHALSPYLGILALHGVRSPDDFEHTAEGQDAARAAFKEMREDVRAREARGR